MFQKLIPRLLFLYGRNYKTISSAQKGYRNECYKVKLLDNTELNLIVYKNEPFITKTIQRANSSSLFVHNYGLPVRTPIDERIVEISVNGTSRYASLYNYLPGETIAWEAYSRKHIKLLGQSLSDLHYYWRDYDGDLEDTHLLLMNQLHKMNDYFYKDGVMKALQKKLKLKMHQQNIKSLERILHLSGHLSPAQPLHMDFVRGNVLFAHNKNPSNTTYSIDTIELTGVLDFEKVSRGHIVFDVARSFAFLMVDCSHYNEQKLRKYFFSSGYNKRGRYTFNYPIITAGNTRIDVFNELVSFYLLYDFFKLLRHNPYEYLEENYHYRRTRDLLLKRAMIQLT